MYLFKAQRLFEADAPCFRRLDEAEVSYKENLFLIDSLGCDAFQFARKRVAGWMAEISRQSCRANDASIMELYFDSLGCRSNLSLPLQADHRIDERRLRPWLRNTLCLPKRNDICGCFFDDAKALSSSSLKIAVLPAPGAPVRINLFILLG